ncbi:hypothetical protein [Tuwongella immobilis]|uniref:Uncharacterized protein n=1 Tax=Tuwongella immobilis TaxID=692036 RepID=A0A6C2YUP0_9BACT|nr:hypothetical protein [Tuwongella immobilis]VIP04873.1 unnamed protein product [Tuwongella immobilis]VTS07105.1 unnamed protein product [Tuwongella immobilis]
MDGAPAAFLIPMLIVATSILALMLSAIAAHAFFVIFESTAAGSRELRWPDEPLTDWAYRALDLTYLLFVSAVPLNLIAFIGWGRGYVVPATMLSCWLVFPLVLLSSMTAVSRYQPLSLSILLRGIQRPVQVVMLLLLSAPVLLVAGLGVQMLLGHRGGGFISTIAGGVLLGLMIPIYSRIIGRFAFLLTFTRDPFAKSAAKAEGDSANAANRKSGNRKRATDSESAAPRAVQAVDPWEAPPPQIASNVDSPALEDRPIFDSDGEVTGYSLNASSGAGSRATTPAADEFDGLSEAIPLAQDDLPSRPQSPILPLDADTTRRPARRRSKLDDDRDGDSDRDPPQTPRKRAKGNANEDDNPSNKRLSLAERNRQHRNRMAPRPKQLPGDPDEDRPASRQRPELLDDLLDADDLPEGNPRRDRILERERKLMIAERPVEPKHAWELSVWTGLLAASPVSYTLLIAMGYGSMGFLLSCIRLLWNTLPSES